MKIFLVGLKSDLEEQREVTYEEGKNFAKIYNIEYFCETSPKDYIRYNLSFNVSLSHKYNIFVVE